MGVSALDYVRQFYSAETSQRKMETILYDVVQESKRSSV